MDKQEQLRRDVVKRYLGQCRRKEHYTHLKSGTVLLSYDGCLNPLIEMTDLTQALSALMTQDQQDDRAGHTFGTCPSSQSLEADLEEPLVARSVVGQVVES